MVARRSCAGAMALGLLLTGCAGNPAKPTESADATSTPPSTNAGRPSDSVGTGSPTKGQGPSRVDDTVVRKGFSPSVSPAQRRAATRFLDFAADPSERTASRMPFASPTITIRLGGRTAKTLSLREARRESSWWLRNGVGTTSALFVLSNSIAKDDGATFLVTPRHLPLCATPEVVGDAPPGTVNVLLKVTGSQACAPGWRIGLELNTEGEVVSVAVSVRAP